MDIYSGPSKIKPQVECSDFPEYHLSLKDLFACNHLCFHWHPLFFAVGEFSAFGTAESNFAFSVTVKVIHDKRGYNESRNVLLIPMSILPKESASSCRFEQRSALSPPALVCSVVRLTFKYDFHYSVTVEVTYLCIISGIGQAGVGEVTV